ncbi:hypothetical protein GCM10025868_16520 [Angustibacter aerolatus]|uniref:Luciferase-like domain-containing protein n=1 Tax=Angustibacter aerolatus TaxID=1162965 RepID=A0ABQ6JHN9_9ACTN|nr:LLM class flavin-dependent oxidoreductase [Angustibacter aerolatus]GMA86402.1 hypothetical protein GCM10025868_16520 [Angustibacter aerolatus]
MRIGVVVLPQQRWPEARERWRAVEDMGFDHAWTYDHLAWRSLADEPWFGTVPVLAAVAAVTERVRLGTWVASPNFRHPVPFAKDVMTLDDVSGGRMLLGVGAGGEGWDADVLGQPRPTPGERVERLDEFLGLLDQPAHEPVDDGARRAVRRRRGSDAPRLRAAAAGAVRGGGERAARDPAGGPARRGVGDHRHHPTGRRAGAVVAGRGRGPRPVPDGVRRASVALPATATSTSTPVRCSR